MDIDVDEDTKQLIISGDFPVILSLFHRIKGKSLGRFSPKTCIDFFVLTLVESTGIETEEAVQSLSEPTKHLWSRRARFVLSWLQYFYQKVSLLSEMVSSEPDNLKFVLSVLQGGVDHNRLDVLVLTTRILTKIGSRLTQGLLDSAFAWLSKEFAEDVLPSVLESESARKHVIPLFEVFGRGRFLHIFSHLIPENVPDDELRMAVMKDSISVFAVHPTSRSALAEEGVVGLLISKAVEKESIAHVNLLVQIWEAFLDEIGGNDRASQMCLAYLRSTCANADGKLRKHTFGRLMRLLQLFSIERIPQAAVIYRIIVRAFKFRDNLEDEIIRPWIYRQTMKLILRIAGLPVELFADGLIANVDVTGLGIEEAKFLFSLSKHPRLSAKSGESLFSWGIGKITSREALLTEEVALKLAESIAMLVDRFHEADEFARICSKSADLIMSQFTPKGSHIWKGSSAEERRIHEETVLQMIGNLKETSSLRIFRRRVEKIAAHGGKGFAKVFQRFSGILCQKLNISTSSSSSTTEPTSATAGGPDVPLLAPDSSRSRGGVSSTGSRTIESGSQSARFDSAGGVSSERKRGGGGHRHGGHKKKVDSQPEDIAQTGEKAVEKEAGIGEEGADTESGRRSPSLSEPTDSATQRAQKDIERIKAQRDARRKKEAEEERQRKRREARLHAILAKRRAEASRRTSLGTVGMSEEMADRSSKEEQPKGRPEKAKIEEWRQKRKEQEEEDKKKKMKQDAERKKKEKEALEKRRRKLHRVLGKEGDVDDITESDALATRSWRTDLFNSFPSTSRGAVVFTLSIVEEIVKDVICGRAKKRIAQKDAEERARKIRLRKLKQRAAANERRRSEATAFGHESSRAHIGASSMNLKPRRENAGGGGTRGDGGARDDGSGAPGAIEKHRAQVEEQRKLEEERRRKRHEEDVAKIRRRQALLKKQLEEKRAAVEAEEKKRKEEDEKKKKEQMEKDRARRKRERARREEEKLKLKEFAEAKKQKEREELEAKKKEEEEERKRREEENERFRKQKQKERQEEMARIQKRKEEEEKKKQEEEEERQMREKEQEERRKKRRDALSAKFRAKNAGEDESPLDASSSSSAHALSANPDENRSRSALKDDSSSSNGDKKIGSDAAKRDSVRGDADEETPVNGSTQDEETHDDDDDGDEDRAEREEGEKGEKLPTEDEKEKKKSSDVDVIRPDGEAETWAVDEGPTSPSTSHSPSSPTKVPQDGDEKESTLEEDEGIVDPPVRDSTPLPDGSRGDDLPDADDAGDVGAFNEPQPPTAPQ
eukprot:TRINITY_DN1570_c0_g1_i2.p1 TRINITY_DN1570_c0_g1~~TRINITY_DN1570_c0_g1_i2.p1  ORF type:complete len:1374 (+),score=532.71 TRINITY_DN1570_c0_g1_i2:267-4124(+)